LVYSNASFFILNSAVIDSREIAVPDSD